MDRPGIIKGNELNQQRLVNVDHHEQQHKSLWLQIQKPYAHGHRYLSSSLLTCDRAVLDDGLANGGVSDKAGDWDN